MIMRSFCRYMAIVFALAGAGLPPAIFILARVHLAEGLDTRDWNAVGTLLVFAAILWLASVDWSVVRAKLNEPDEAPAPEKETEP